MSWEDNNYNYGNEFYNHNESQNNNDNNYFESHNPEDTSDINDILNNDEQYSENNSEDYSDNEISTSEDSIDDIEEKIQKIPNNTSNEMMYSMKDIYRVYNVIVILDSFGEEVSEWVVSTLGINTKANKVKRAVEISSIEKSEFDSKTFAMDILKSIYEVDNPVDEASHDQVKATMDAINEIMGITDNEKSTVLSLVKDMAKEVTGSKVNIKATKKSPETIIFSDIRELLNENPEISHKISILNTALNTIKEKAL